MYNVCIYIYTRVSTHLYTYTYVYMCVYISTYCDLIHLVGEAQMISAEAELFEPHVDFIQVQRPVSERQ